MNEGDHEAIGIDGAEGKKPDGSAPPGAIDVTKLAAKVYKLMLDEIRLERARGSTARKR